MHIAVIDDQAATREATVKLIRQLAQPSQPLQVAAYSNALTVAKLKHLIEKVASQTQPKLLALQTAAGLVRVPMYDISAIEVTDHRLQVHTQKNHYLVNGQLKDFLPRLDDNFIQIYRSIVINLNFLSQLDKRTVVMADGTTYPVSRQQAPLVKQAFFKHFRGLTHDSN